MAAKFNLKKPTPMLLIVGAVAIIGGIFLARRLQGGKSADTSGEVAPASPPIITHPVADLADVQELAELRQQIGELQQGRDTGYPPISEPAKPLPGQPVPPPAQKPTQPAPTQPVQPAPVVTPKILSFLSLPPNATTAGEPVTIEWDTSGAKSVVLHSSWNNQTVSNLPAKGSRIDRPTAGNHQWILGITNANNQRAATRTVIRNVKPATRSDRPAPQPPPPSNPSVPGNYPETCSGVSGRPTDHPGRDIVAFARRKGEGPRGRAIALEWAVMGIANSGQTGLSRFTRWAANEANWPRINQTRRSRGLKALNRNTFTAMVNTLHQMNASTGGRDDKFSDAQLQQLWEAYHMPYLC